jgi:peptidoglycan/LPS O-acetylase OafA/YrhL
LSGRSNPFNGSSTGKLGYVPALDGLRGLAIAAVVGVHYFDWPPGGELGVDLFFVLSGFLITTLLLEERGKGPISLRRFYRRRARRLLPALAVMLAFYLVAEAARGRDALKPVLLGGLYFANFVQAFQNPNPLAHTGLVPLWSLSQEEQFYVVWPLLLLALMRRRTLAWLLTILVALVVYRAVLVFGGASDWRVYFGPDTHADGLVGGALLAILRLRHGLRSSPRLANVGLVVFWLALFVQPFLPAWEAWGLPVAEAACVILVASAVAETPLGSALSARPLVWVGRISYSLYLWNLALPVIVGSRNPWLMLPLSVAAAYASFRFVEEPFRRRRPRGLEPAVQSSAATG